MQNIWRKVTIVVVIVVLCLVVVLTFILVRGHNCDSVMADCDAFGAVCATSGGDHQFFYSECAMKVENCLTGKGWKPDEHLNHCNVYER